MSRLPDSGTKARSHRDAAEVLKATLAATPCPVVVVDGEGRIRGGWNAPAVKLLGWTSSEVKGRSLPDLLALRTADGARLAVSPDNREQGLPPTSALVTTRAGEAIPVEVSTTPFRNADQRVTGAVVFLEDRSHRRTLEAQLRQSQKLEAVGQLAGGIAHDFNNLLTIVQTNAELLADELEGAGTTSSEHLADIQDAVSRGSELVRRLMAFGRSDPDDVRSLDIGSLVSNYADTLQRVLPDSIQVEVTVGPDLPPVTADPGAIQQVILNLATNARDAMPGGGRLAFTVARRAPDSSDDDQDRVRLSVCDTGVGIDADMLEHVFEPFFTTKAPDRGTGLGLSMVRELTRQMGGSVEVSSTPGIGTEFHIDLPAGFGGTEGPDASEAGAKRAPSVGSGTILVVEDDTSVRKVIRRALTGAGYDVIVTADGEQALEAYHTHPHRHRSGRFRSRHAEHGRRQPLRRSERRAGSAHPLPLHLGVRGPGSSRRGATGPGRPGPPQAVERDPAR